MQVYLPIAEMSADALLLVGIGFGVGWLSGLFGVGGGFLLTPLLILIGIPSTGRGRLRRQPDARRQRVRPHRAMAARQCGRADGRRAAGRRPARLLRRGAALRAAAPGRAGGPRGIALLRGGAGHGRRADGDGIGARHPAPPPRRSAPAARALLDARAAAEGALPQVAPLHLGHPAGPGGLRHRPAFGGDGGGRRLHAGAGHDLPDRHADRRW